MVLVLACSLSIYSQTALQKKGKSLDQALIDQNIKAIQKISTSDAIFMLDYQRTLRGHEHIQQYYKQLFAEQKIKSLRKDITETITLGDYVIEIGIFMKTLTRTSDNVEINHEGKFWHIWKKIDGEIRLFSYVEGYHKELDRNEYVVVDMGIEPKNNGNLELIAYAALDEKAIREWDPEIRINLYTDDAIFYPFADSAKVGIETLKPYLRSYHQYDILIDLIKSKPFEFVYLNDYVLQFSTFEVDWRFEESSGTNKGKGIKLWKRQSDQSLKIYRHIGLHNELNP